MCMIYVRTQRRSRSWGRGRDCPLSTAATLACRYAGRGSSPTFQRMVHSWVLYPVLHCTQCVALASLHIGKKGRIDDLTFCPRCTAGALLGRLLHPHITSSSDLGKQSHFMGRAHSWPWRRPLRFNAKRPTILPTTGGPFKLRHVRHGLGPALKTAVPVCRQEHETFCCT
jgi:hypothetical protein